MTNFGIIIDTEQYAGNFERELCAFLTGKVGECGVGQEYAAENPLFDNVVEKPDEHGCCRPCEIYPTPGWFNNGLGGHFRDGGDAPALEAYQKYAIEHATKQVEQGKFIKAKLEAGENYNTWTIADCKRHIQRAEKEIRTAKKLKQVNKYPAYLSVLIHMDSAPTKDQIKHIKKELPKFQAIHRKSAEYMKDFKLTITGVRVLEEKTLTKTRRV